METEKEKSNARKLVEVPEENGYAVWEIRREINQAIPFEHARVITVTVTPAK
jgi:hypothetical protein